MDLPSLTNPDTIEDRNKQDIAEKTRKKMEYQKELIRQIEDKRKEVELLREKEKREEEMLTKWVHYGWESYFFILLITFF